MIIKKLKVHYFVVLLIMLVPTPVFATTIYSSPSYSVDQVFFGAGGSDNQSSTNYQSQVSVGELGIGNVSSPNYQAYVGFNTTSDPFLQFVVTANNIDLGYLSTSSTSTATGTFYVRAWQSSGYAIYTDSSPPTNQANYALATPSTPTASSAGTEQFGINLVANTSPITFGASPVQTTSFAYGAAAANYATANEYMYHNGDEIAYCNKSTSSTVYTISYIFNINSATEDGLYTFNHVLVATADY